MNETNRVLTRDEIPDQYKWNAPSVFADWAAWEKGADEFAADLERLTAFKGRLAESPQVLLEAIEVYSELGQKGGKILVYAMLNQAMDTNDQQAAMAAGKASGLFGQFAAAASFLDPELLEIGQERLYAWMDTEPALRMMAHYLDDLFRKQAHVRSAEVEELLGMLSVPFRGTSSVESMLTNADFKFMPAKDSEGVEHEVTQSSLRKILAGTDREARRTAWQNYNDQYLAYRNTLTENLATSVKQNVFRMRARRHESTLSMVLDEHNIPTSVFHNLVDTFQKNLPTWHRYWRARRKILGVDTLNPYDIWAPLTSERSKIEYAEAVDMICEGLMPMGKDYVAILRQGALKDRWVDVYPNQGKSAGAFSAGWKGTFPFIMISYNDDIFSVSTLAHELGHSMHSYLTWENQPFIYSDYSLFVAEVASNFHQAMVRDSLLRKGGDLQFQISIIEEAMSNFHRYFFIMPTLARFELEVHERFEKGGGMSADGMIDLMAGLFADGYGDEVNLDHDRVGITWATFSHLYIDYYVYQYATGISGANALSRRILDGAPHAVEDYLGFLKAGGSQYPLDVLKGAGVDLLTPEPVEVTFSILGDMVDRLETLADEVSS